MSVVVRFPGSRRPHLSRVEQKLRDRLANSKCVVARGGSVQPGAGGLVLFRNGHALGCWTVVESCFQWSSTATGQPAITVATLDAAHDKAVEILGPLPEDRFRNALEQYRMAADGYGRAAFLEAVLRTSRGVIENKTVLPPELLSVLEIIAAQYQAFDVAERQSLVTYADASAMLKRLFF